MLESEESDFKLAVGIYKWDVLALKYSLHTSHKGKEIVMSWHVLPSTGFWRTAVFLVDDEISGGAAMTESKCF